MGKVISSINNPEIKHLRLLKEKSRERKKSGLFVIEGKRELSLAIKGGYTITKLYYYPELFSESEAKSLEHYKIEIIEISREIFERLAHRSSTEGIIALAQIKHLNLEELELKNSNPLILVAEAPEKPGNIGALLRTADAANLDAIIIANPKTDMFNPNIIRSSVGCVFTVHIAVDSTAKIIEFLKEKNISICSASLEEAIDYTKVDFKKAAAIIVGTEATGLSNHWLKASKYNIKIPMQGEIDSLNVSVAAGILIFEAKRQRLNSR